MFDVNLAVFSFIMLCILCDRKLERMLAVRQIQGADISTGNLIVS